jgi:hypothetical protein
LKQEIKLPANTPWIIIRLGGGGGGFKILQLNKSDINKQEIVKNHKQIKLNSSQIKFLDQSISILPSSFAETAHVNPTATVKIFSQFIR